MNREAIKELYAMDDFVWAQIVEILSSEDIAKTAPGSGWPNLHNCLAHIIFGYDNWLAFMTGEPPTGIGERVQTLDEVNAARTDLRTRVDALMAGLTDDELQSIRTFNIRGDNMPYSYAELLAHLALHERGHHGDVTTLFWQLGIEADTSFEYRFHLERTPL